MSRRKALRFINGCRRHRSESEGSTLVQQTMFTPPCRQVVRKCQMWLRARISNRYRCYYEIKGYFPSGWSEQGSMFVAHTPLKPCQFSTRSIFGQDLKCRNCKSFPPSGSTNVKKIQPYNDGQTELQSNKLVFGFKQRNALDSPNQSSALNAASHASHSLDTRQMNEWMMSQLDETSLWVHS